MTNTTTQTIGLLTAKGLETMKAIGNQELSFFDDGVVAGSGIWGSNLSEEMGHASSGVINRLKALGLFEHVADEEDAGGWWTLTALGADVANALADKKEGLQLAEYTVETTQELVETVEAPMTKTEAYEWVKRARSALRDADEIIYKNNGDLEFVIEEAICSLAEIQGALAHQGIKGVTS